MRINNNPLSIDAQRNIAMTQTSMAKSVERLSSGLRINRAADDAAGLSISEKMRGQIKGLDQAGRNAQDGISMIQTAEGALNETHSILQRMRELAVQGANDTLTTNDRTAISQELTSLTAEIDRISSTTQFNGKSLLNGTLGSTVAGGSGVKLGTALGGTSTAIISRLDVSNAAGHTFNITAAGAAVTLTDATTNLSQTLTAADMSAGTTQQTLNFTSLGISFDLTASGAGANDTAALIAAGLQTAANVTVTSGSATLLIGANATQTMTVAATSADSTAIGNAGGYASLNAAVAGFTANVASATETTVSQNLITSIDKAIGDISDSRSKLGASQNRLEHTINNLAVASENLTGAESRIRDADMAKEMAGFTRAQILTQAGTAILAQANQVPGSVLDLLRA